MLYHYVAQDEQGRIKEGNVSQPNLEAALDYLTRQKLKPLSVKPLKFEEKKRSLFKESISLTDKVFLIRYLSLMLKVGTDLFSAIDILIEYFESGPIRRFLLEIRSHLEQGKPFSLAFEQHPEIFSSTIANLIKAGETSGNLEITLEQVTKNLEKEKSLNRKIISSITYPIILVIASFAMVVFLVTFAIPRLGEMFLSTGQPIPTYTRIVLTVGMFLNKYIYIFVPLFIAIPLALYFYFFKTKGGKEMLNSLLEKIPMFRNVIEKMALQRLSSTLASLIKAGMPITQAINVTADAVGYSKYAEALKRISSQYLAQGLNIGEAFRKETVFPSVLTNLIAISEKAGRMDEILITLSNFYEEEIDTSLKTLTSLIDPLLLLVLGLVVGGIALSLIVPIYQLIGQF
ncbi:MAG TPA: type II secretion system F family protein [Candidatus Pacearchaeota archaeon]|nr:type II secretion system F family protein [Candidatus Pacearchaeota archaeon]